MLNQLYSHHVPYDRIGLKRKLYMLATHLGVEFHLEEENTTIRKIRKRR